MHGLAPTTAFNMREILRFPIPVFATLSQKVSFKRYPSNSQYSFRCGLQSAVLKDPD